jgi:Uma2 family endonuclease
MTRAEPIPLTDQQHIVLDDVSWELYEHLLREVGDRAIRLTYSEGSLEIMSPLPRHEKWSRRIGSLIQFLCVERNIRMVPLGSTTFRDAAKKKGLEPDECFYIKHAHAAAKMEEEFEPGVDPPPDLVVEIDITRRSVARQPIYAALGVPELWRFDGKRLEILLLETGRYELHDSSPTFPFLPVMELQRFLDRMRGPEADDTAVLREFQQWVRTLKP